MSAWLSITGLYAYQDDIFDLMQLPTVEDLHDRDRLIDPIEPIDREDLIDNILFELAELGLVYADGDMLKYQIGLWSRINKRIWADLWETLLYKYNPIWNKDGKVTEERERTGSGTETASGTATTVQGERWDMTGKVLDSGSSSESGSGSSTITKNETNLHKVTGFDSDTLRDDTSDNLSGTDTENRSNTISGTTGNIRDIQEGRQRTGNETSTTGSSGQKTDEMRETYERIEQGNIGVTTTQAMIKEQREVVRMNLYKEITESFKQRFCILVY